MATPAEGAEEDIYFAEAWLCRAPKRLADAYIEERTG
jgi:hypothetical protein